MKLYNAGFCRVLVYDELNKRPLTFVAVNVDGIPSDLYAQKALEEIRTIWTNFNVSLETFKEAVREAYVSRTYRDLITPNF